MAHWWSGLYLSNNSFFNLASALTLIFAKVACCPALRRDKKRSIFGEKHSEVNDARKKTTLDDLFSHAVDVN